MGRVGSSSRGRPRGVSNGKPWTVAGSLKAIWSISINNGELVVDDGKWWLITTNSIGDIPICPSVFPRDLDGFRLEEKVMRGQTEIQNMCVGYANEHVHIPIKAIQIYSHLVCFFLRFRYLYILVNKRGANVGRITICNYNLLPLPVNLTVSRLKSNMAGISGCLGVQWLLHSLQLTGYRVTWLSIGWDCNNHDPQQPLLFGFLTSL